MPLPHLDRGRSSSYSQGLIAHAYVNLTFQIGNRVRMATVYKIRPVKLVGSKIRQLRKEHKLTQTELSSRIGIQQSDLSRMEKGEYRVSLDALFRILSEFQISIGEFFEDMARESMNERDLRLIREFQSLDEGARRDVEELLSSKTSGQKASAPPTEPKRRASVVQASVVQANVPRGSVPRGTLQPLARHASRVRSREAT